MIFIFLCPQTIKNPSSATALQLGLSHASLSDRMRVKHVINLNRSVSFLVELFSVHCDVYYKSHRYK